jgi:hypothetical protein
MHFALRPRIAGVLLSLLAAGCSLATSQPPTDPTKRWVLISNLFYADGNGEPQYVWVEEGRIPTSLTTVLFGKTAVIAPPDVVPRYAPPPGNGIISPLQGSPYAEARLQPAAGAAAARPSTAGRSPVSPGGVAAATLAPGLTPRGYVVYVDAKRVVIDMTAQHGLKAGDIVNVTREGISLRHPVTGAPLGELDEEVATAQIVEVRERFSIAEIREVKPGAQIRVKDKVVRRP